MKTGFLSILLFLLQTIYKLDSCVQILRSIGALNRVEQKIFRPRKDDDMIAFTFNENRFSFLFLFLFFFFFFL